MQSNMYAFVTRWTVPGTASKVYAILNDVAGYPRWWPSLATSFQKISDGQGGKGASGHVVTKGFLPYSLQWTYEVTATNPPHGFSIKAFGDVAGDGRWELSQNGDMVDVVYHWTVRGERPLLKYLSPLLRPLFSLNHDYVMKKGEEGLRKELQRVIVA